MAGSSSRLRVPAIASVADDLYDPTAKRQRRQRIYGLRSFMDPRCPTDFAGAFRDNIRRFVEECADVEDPDASTWRTMLVDETSGVVAPLYTVEERVSTTDNPFCDYCRCNGWSHHFVSKIRYHLIIPADEDWDKPLNADVFHVATHLLHGLLHCNGFGHLLIINGREGGSKFISGHLLMDLWDRFCTALRVREVTVEDASRKYSVDLRLLLGIAYGRPWFARWGYRFHCGSFGLTEEAYTSAIQELTSLPIGKLLDSPTTTDHEVLDLFRIVSTYSSPHCSTIRDLLRHLLDLKRRAPLLPLPPPPKPMPDKSAKKKKRKKKKEKKKKKKKNDYRNFDDVAEELASRWPARRLKFAAEVVVDALIEHDGMMTRQEVRNAARLTIGDTGLLDFVLKSLGDTIVGTNIVHRTTNPSTRVLEFTLDNLDNVGNNSESESETETEPTTPEPTPPVSVEEDLATVYNGIAALCPEAARAVLDAKHWRKEFELRDEFDDRLRFFVQWVPNVVQIEGLTRALPPAELVVLDPHASIMELKAETEKAMRSTYFIMERFRVLEVDGVEGEDWEPVMLGGAESGSVIWVRGEGADINCEMKYEGGADTWAVGCECGAREDDGERMVACDACDVWHHTRCIGISDDEPAPQMFLCARCGRSILSAAVAEEEEIKEEIVEMV